MANFIGAQKVKTDSLTSHIRQKLSKLEHFLCFCDSRGSDRLHGKQPVRVLAVGGVQAHTKRESTRTRNFLYFLNPPPPPPPPHYRLAHNWWDTLYTILIFILLVWLLHSHNNFFSPSCIIYYHNTFWLTRTTRFIVVNLVLTIR